MKLSLRAWLLAVAVLVVLAVPSAAVAQSIGLIDPDPMTPATFGPVNVGATSAPLRFEFKNFGTASPMSLMVYLDSPTFAIVAMPTEDNLELCGGMLTLEYRDAEFETRYAYATFNCVARRVPFHATSLGFADSGPGTHTMRPLYITNTSDVPREIASVTSSDPAFNVLLHAGHLPAVIPPEGMVRFEVWFEPPAAAADQPFYSTVTVVQPDATLYPILQLSGRSHGFVSTRLPWNGQSIQVGRSWSYYGELSNYTDVPVTITSLAISSPQFALIGASVGTVLPPQTDLEVMVQATPPSLFNHDMSYTLAYDNGIVVSQTGYVRGAPGRLEITTTDGTPNDGVLDLGMHERSDPPVEQTISLHNPTATAISVASHVHPDDDPAFEIVGTLPSMIAAGATATVGVRFTPGPPHESMLWPRHFSTLHVREGGNLEYEILLTARVRPLWLRPSATELVFPDTEASPATPPVLELAVTNLGREPIPVPAVAVTGAGCSLLPLPTGMLAPMQSATYRVGFTPPAAGTFEGEISIPGYGALPLRGVGTAPDGDGDGSGDDDDDDGDGDGHGHGHGGGGCSARGDRGAAGGAGGLALAVLVLLRRSRRSRRSRGVL